ncbi:MAG: hypothetical protein P8P32_05760 [Akkermansiaceae bacterium]|nr:hypothetical protein [Akkermansiaceae bacterium]
MTPPTSLLPPSFNDAQSYRNLGMLESRATLSTPGTDGVAFFDELGLI